MNTVFNWVQICSWGQQAAFEPECWRCHRICQGISPPGHLKLDAKLKFKLKFWEFRHQTAVDWLTFQPFHGNTSELPLVPRYHTVSAWPTNLNSFLEPCCPAYTQNWRWTLYPTIRHVHIVSEHHLFTFAGCFWGREPRRSKQEVSKNKESEAWDEHGPQSRKMFEVAKSHENGRQSLSHEVHDNAKSMIMRRGFSLSKQWQGEENYALLIKRLPEMQEHALVVMLMICLDWAKLCRNWSATLLPVGKKVVSAQLLNVWYGWWYGWWYGCCLGAT